MSEPIPLKEVATMIRANSRSKELSAAPKRFGLLLALLVASFLISGVDSSPAVRVMSGILTLAIVLVVFVNTKMRRNTVTVAVLLPAALAGGLLVTAPDGDVANAIGASLLAFVLSAITLAVLAEIITETHVTVRTILGAISAYFMLGLIFAWIYLAIPGFVGDQTLSPPTDGELPVYFSFTVLTTLGFGDIVPVGSLIERVTILEALTGQLFLATLIARFVTVLKVSRSTGTADA